MRQYLGQPSSRLHCPFITRMSFTCYELYIPAPILRPPVSPDVPSSRPSLDLRPLPQPSGGTMRCAPRSALQTVVCAVVGNILHCALHNANCGVHCGRQYIAHCMPYCVVWQAIYSTVQRSVTNCFRGTATTKLGLPESMCKIL